MSTDRTLLTGSHHVYGHRADEKLVRWHAIRWYAVTRRRGLRVWVSWKATDRGKLPGDPLVASSGLWTVKVIGELIEGIAGRAGLKNVREVGSV
jgi:hypothetical protein